MAKASHDNTLNLVSVYFLGYIKLIAAYTWEWLHWLADATPSSPALKFITGSVRLMPLMEKKISDKHWDDKIAHKPFRTPNDVLAHLKQCEYRVGHLLTRQTPINFGARAAFKSRASVHWQS